MWKMSLVLGFCALSASGCAVPVATLEPVDPGAPVDVDEPAPEVRQRTISCDFGSGEGLDLASGEVRALTEANPRMDIECYLGRYLVLQSGESTADAAGDAGGLCEVADPSTRFDAVDDIPGDAGACAWGAHVLCGVNMDPYAPTCEGRGFLVRDAARTALYRVLIVEDALDERGTFTLDYVAVP